MKKCPFCAEEIQDEAIKCKHCGSMISAAPPRPDGEAAPKAKPEAKPAEAAPAEAKPAEAAPGQTPAQRAVSVLRSGPPDEERKILYVGSPSWRAYFAAYSFIVLGTLLVPVGAQWVAAQLDTSVLTRILSVLIPIAVGAVAFFGITFWRKSMVFRVTTSNIETESGVLSKKIDVLELWRCRDIRYKQALSDRILGIAHIEIFTADVTTPQLEIVGFPASRQLFEQIRDSIQIQRHAKNVVGFVQ